MAEPIAQPAGGANLLQMLLGQQTGSTGSSSTLAQQLQQALTQGSTTGTTTGNSSATTSTTAQLGPLLEAFTRAQAGMDPTQLSALIQSIFTEGAQAVPALTQQYANSTGSRVSGNSGLNLALGDLNKNLSSQVVQQLLQYNQSSQQTAGNIASQIAGNTRQTQQTGNNSQQTAGTTTQSQQQTGSTSTNQTTKNTGKQGVNPSMATLVGAGGTALNWLDKKGVFDGIFGRGGGAGTIGTPTLNPAGPMLTNGGGAAAGTMMAPAASQGFLQAAPPANPYGYTPGSGGGGALPTISPMGGGITSLGGYTTPGGGIGSGGFNFGDLSPSTNVFGTASADSLGSNLDFGGNPYDYGGSSTGITGVMNPNLSGGFSDAVWGGMNNAMTDFGNWGGDALSGIGDFLGGAADWVGSFFADGGEVGNRGIGAPGDMRYGSGSPGTAAPVRLPAMNIFDGTSLRREMQAGLTPLPQTMQQGTNVKVPAGTPTGVDPTMSAVASLLPFLLGKGLGFADGGQVQTGGTPTRTRNQNYMGQRQERERSTAMNYEGYAPSAAGSSQPAGGSPSMASIAAPLALAPGFSAQSMGDPNAQAKELFRQAVAREQAASDLFRLNQGVAGGSGGVGEGGAPGQNEADNGAMGIGPSGIAAAPPGTGQAVSIGLGQIGMVAPAVASVLGLISSLASAVNAANNAGVGSPGTASADSQGAVTSPVSQSTVTGIDIGPVDVSGVGDTGAGVGASGGPGSGTDGGPGDSGVGGDSAGDGTSGSAGTSAGGDAWADGGLVRGPGTGTSDSVTVKPRAAGGKQIYYSDGEYVIPKDVVDTLGVDLFDRIVSAHHTPAARQ